MSDNKEGNKKNNMSQQMLMGLMKCSICHSRVDHMKELKEVLVRVRKGRRR